MKTIIIQKAFLSLFVFALFFVEVFAQQKPLFSQYMLNQYLINPAVAGTAEDYHLNAGFRQQWVGVPDAPQTFYVSGHGHVGKEHALLRRRHKNQNTWHHGLGFLLSGDRTGPISQYKFGLSYAYDFSITKTLRMSFGLTAGLYNRNLNVQKLKFYEENSTSTEEIISRNNINEFRPDVDAGAWIYHPLFYAGIAANQLLMNPLGSPYNRTNGVNRLTQHYYATAGGLFHPSREIAIIPSFMFRMTQDAWSKPSLDLNCKVKYQNKVWGGVSYRNNDAIVGLVGILWDNRYEFGYAYDYTLNSLNINSSGSHEIMVGYRIVPKAHVMSPSDFW